MLESERKRFLAKAARIQADTDIPQEARTDLTNQALEKFLETYAKYARS